MNYQLSYLFVMIITSFCVQSDAQNCVCNGCSENYDLSAGEDKTFPYTCSSGLYTATAFNIAVTDDSSFTVSTDANGYFYPDYSSTDNLQCLSAPLSGGTIQVIPAGSLFVVVTCENYLFDCSIQQHISFACESSCTVVQKDCIDKCNADDLRGVRNNECSETDGVATEYTCDCNPAVVYPPPTLSPTPSPIPSPTPSPTVTKGPSIWVGKWYEDVGINCDRESCCCFDKATIVDSGDLLEFQLDFESDEICDTYDFTIPYPEGNEFQVNIDGPQMDVSISGHTITWNDIERPECSETTSRFRDVQNDVQTIDSNMAIGAIIGIVLGCMFLVGICIGTSVYYQKSKKVSTEDNGYNLMSDAGDLQPNNAIGFFRSWTQKIIFSITILQVIISILYVVGLGMMFTSWDNLLKMLGDDHYYVGIPPGAALLFALPWIAIMTSFFLTCMSWKVNLYCLYCGIPFLYSMYISLFAVYLFFLSFVQAIIDDLLDCYQLSPNNPSEMLVDDICSYFFDGYQLVFFSSIFIEATLLIQTILSCFRGFSSSKEVTNKTTVVVTQPAIQYQHEPVHLGSM